MSEARFQSVEAPVQFDGPQFGAEMVQVENMVRSNKARHVFQVDGAGLAVAILDTGLRATHDDFSGRVIAQRNFTADNGGNSDNANDGHGHGTNVTGVIAASGRHVGIAPRVNIAAMKVLDNSGGGTFAAARDALNWVLSHRDLYNITAVCMSLSDGSNHQSDVPFAADDLYALIGELRARAVAVVVAAGNDYHRHGSRQGMAYPGIVRHAISVGSVYDFNEGGFRYDGGAEAFVTAPDLITPFSQRLHAKVGGPCRTDIFAPGAPITSSGVATDAGESVQHGTSQAAPITVGVVLLLQQFYKARTGQLPTVDQIEGWLRAGGVEIVDADGERDNVLHSGLTYVRLDAIGAMDAARRGLQRTAFLTRQPLSRLAGTFLRRDVSCEDRRSWRAHVP